jgi:transposase
VITYIFPKRNSAKRIYNDISVKLGDKRPSYYTVRNWVARFKTGHLSTEDKDVSGRPIEVTIPGNVDTIHP